MSTLNKLCLAFFVFAIALLFAGRATAAQYSVQYRVAVLSETGVARVQIVLAGEELPSKLTLHLNPDRHINIKMGKDASQEGRELLWTPKGSSAHIQYDFVIDEQKGSDSYDSLITDSWAVLRSDKLIPPISVRAKKSLVSKAELHLKLPVDWSSAAPYALGDDGEYLLQDGDRRFVRPKGWLLLGDIAGRRDDIGHSKVWVAAPKAEDARLQDTLAFLHWNLPELMQVFPHFPDRLLVVSAGNPMWRGGLSGTRSLFMHSDRPLISGNRTSSLIHELVHVGTGIHGDKESDWIVEGLAEYYAVEILRRSGGISERRYLETLEELADWGSEAPSLLVKRSAAETTARAAYLMYQLDLHIQQASEGKRSLDTVSTALAEQRGRITLAMFTELVEAAAGESITLLQRDVLSRPSTAPET